MENLESPSAQSQFTTKTGVTLEQLAKQCAERYAACLEQEVPDWEEVSPNDKSRWMEAIDVISESISNAIDTSFSKLTRSFIAIYHAADKWDSMEKPERLAFESCVRHVVNMVVSEDAADVKDAMEYNWAEWVNSKKED